ncbi:MAG: zinc ABC transporter substrate-binding protein [Oscillospiraceae bacterium]|nr:zinc ABC transporter substrate-binding protein [Oscillospiraceae bacterium]
MKKLLSIALCLALLAGLAAGCGSFSPSSDKLSIVTTIFPIYDWVTQILGGKAEQAEVAMLLDSGVDLHNYEPTADDIARISYCDMFLYVGGESDRWAEDVLAQAENKDMVVVNLLDVLGNDAKEEEIKEGMQADEAEDDGEDEAVEYDEHVWLSLRNADKLCRYISDKLCQIDAENADAYQVNTDAYLEKLNALDAEYQAVVDAAAVKTLLFGDRFPFRYLAADYGLDYYAAFVGCSAESEASFETIAFLAGKLDELGLKTILQIESADGKIAATIRDATKAKDQTILTLNSMQSTTAADVKNGASYLSIMESNLAVLREALS